MHDEAIARLEPRPVGRNCGRPSRINQSNGDQACGDTTVTGTRPASLTMRSRMNRPAPGAASLGYRLEKTITRRFCNGGDRS